MKKILGFGIVAAIVISLTAVGSQLMACNEENNFVDCLVNTKTNQQLGQTQKTI